MCLIQMRCDQIIDISALLLTNVHSLMRALVSEAEKGNYDLIIMGKCVCGSRGAHTHTKTPSGVWRVGLLSVGVRVWRCGVTILWEYRSIG